MADSSQAQPPTRYIYGLAASPAAKAAGSLAGGACFAATSDGLLCSDDGGLSWRDALAALALGAPLPATSVALSPQYRRDRTVLAGVPGGILASRDGGGTWGTALLPEPAPFIAALALSPAFADDATAFAATVEDGVFVTRDGGARWEAWNIGLLDHSTLCLAVSPAFERDGTLFVGVESGVFSSANGGRFWHELPFAPDDAPALSIAVSPAFERDGTLFVGGAERGLFVSGDRGQSWRQLPLGEGAVNALILSPEYPAQPHLLALREDELLLSRDDGRTWAHCVEGASVVAVAAPQGLAPGAPLLVGLADGQAQVVLIDE